MTKRQTTNKCPKPASKLAQLTWAGFSSKLKKELLITLPNQDKDKVSTGFDCQPMNPKKQESFLPADASYLAKNPRLRVGRSLGVGCVGEVREVKDNKRLVIKHVRNYTGATDVVEDIKDGKFGKRELQKEADVYKKYNLEKQPLFIPTATAKLGDQKKLALIRPKITIIVEYYPKFHVMNKNRVTEPMLRKLRNDLITLSKRGFIFVDGLQLGIDDANRFLVYDIGFLEKVTPGTQRAFDVNNVHWKEFINEFPGGIRKYGEITSR